MDFGNMIGDSFEYAKEALMEKWLKWILLIIPFMTHGYALEIFKGTKPAPEINDWVANFINGIKLVILVICYWIPLILIPIIGFFLGAGAGAATGLTTSAATGNSSDAILGLFAMGGIVLLFLLIAVVYGIALIFILPFAAIRFARTDSYGEALNIREILASISKVGWLSYIIALIVLLISLIVFGIVMGIIYFILLLIPILGWALLIVIELLLIPAIGIFVARYFTQIYDSAA